MRKILSLAMGFGLGTVAGAALVMLFSPVSGEQVTANLKRGWQETMAEARRASAARQAELEAQLATMRAKHTTPRLPG